MMSSPFPAYEEVEEEEEPEETEPFVLEGRVTPEEEEIRSRSSMNHSLNQKR